MAFPTTGILDNFNRGDTGPPPSASWTTSENGHTVYSQKMRGYSGININVSTWNAASFGPDVEAYITSVTTTGTLAIYIKANGEPGDAYQVSIDDGANTVTMFRDDDSVDTQLGASISHSPAAGNSYGTEYIGGTLKAYYKTSGGSWTELGSRTDTTYQSQSGYTSILDYGQHETDDFGGGTVVAEPAGGGKRTRTFRGPFLGPFRGSVE